MDDPLPVRLLQRVRDLGSQAQGLIEGDRPLRDAVRERLALEELHDQVFGRTFPADVVERADVRMRELGDRPRLAFEALARLLGIRQSGRQDLDRHLAAEPRVPRPVDLSHPARAERRKDLVGTEAGAGGKAHGPPGNGPGFYRPVRRPRSPRAGGAARRGRRGRIRRRRSRRIRRRPEGRSPMRSFESAGGISASTIATIVVTNPRPFQSQLPGGSAGHRHRAVLAGDLETQLDRGGEHVEVGQEVDDQRRVDELQVRVLDRLALRRGEDEDRGEPRLEEQREPGRLPLRMRGRRRSAAGSGRVRRRRECAPSPRARRQRRRGPRASSKSRSAARAREARSARRPSSPPG